MNKDLFGNDIEVIEEDLVVLEKPMVESLTELLNGELEWRVGDAESDEE